MDFISAFITDAVNNGIIPKSTTSITPSNTFRRIQSQTDKGGKKSISYWLRIEHDFAYGYIKDFKLQIERRFKSYNNDPNLSRADITRIKAMLKARQAEEEIAIAERHAKIAVRAKQKVSVSKSIGTTPYLKNKRIGLLSALIYGENQVLVPITSDGTDIVSWQIIYPDGTKRFPFGGQTSGCYHIIGQIDPTKPIIICEGFATGASLSMALSPSYNVVVSFNAGNLLPVAKKLRKKYNTPIIIAGDNDTSQTGQKSAAKCIQSVANTTAIICPEIGKDFNDLDPDAIKKAFGVQDGGSGVEVPSGMQPLDNPPAAADWMANIITDSKGRIVSTSLQNSILYMLYHQDFEGVFAYDEFRQETMVVKCPPWEHENRFKVDSVSDIHITKASATLERYGLSCTIDKTAKAIDVVADENKFHSAREYLKTLEWDKTQRLENFCQEYFGTTQEAPDYLSFIFKKWLTASVKRVMEPGCKFDHVLILESQQQGLYKSEFLKCMATFNGERYHTDSVSISQLDNKDTILKMQGNLIVELAELSGFSKKEDNDIKNWMTQTVDEVRIPFARKTVIYPRQFVFAATTNNYDYLRDPSGNRRYWPVTIEKAIDIEKIEDIKHQLWAEAVHNYKDGLYIGPTPEENALAEIERSKRLQSDAWEEIVMQAVDRVGMDEFKTSDVLGYMDLKTNEKNDRAVSRISKILKANGYNNEPRWDRKAQKNVRVWSK